SSLKGRARRWCSEMDTPAPRMVQPPPERVLSLPRPFGERVGVRGLCARLPLPPETWPGRVSARRPAYLSLSRQRIVGQRKASRMRCPFAALRAHCAARCARGARKLAFGSDMRAPFPERPCAAQPGHTAKRDRERTSLLVGCTFTPSPL